MGCVPLSLETINRHISRVGGFNGLKMMELGSQQMYCNPNIPEGSAAKAWFTRLGAEHVSIDRNGELGAFPMDLAHPIRREEWEKHFDLVTDFGTSEHVGESLNALYNCRANCHDWCRVGGLLIFCNPKRGHWPKHGYHFFTVDHYQRLAEACGYGVLDLWDHPTLGNHVDGYQVSAVLLKQSDAPFISEERYIDLCQGTVFTS